MDHPLNAIQQPSSSGMKQQTILQQEATCSHLWLAVPNTQGKKINIPLAHNIPYYPQTEKEQKPHITFLTLGFRWQMPLSINVKPNPSMAILDYAMQSDYQRSRQLQHKPALNTAIKENPRLRPGWLYIFKESYLWREFQIVAQSYLSEIDLNEMSGRDDRMATGLTTQKVVVPYKIRQQTCHYEMAYSEVQWSWARVNYYGGMAPQDSRCSQLSSVAKGKSKQHRQQRMQIIDLAKYWKPGNKSSPITILLLDPLGLVRRVQQDLLTQWLLLVHQLNIIGKRRFFDSAVLAQQLFFGPQAKPTPYLGPMFANLPIGFPNTTYAPTARVDEGNILYEASQCLDHKSIKKVLSTQKRKDIRQHIRSLQQILVTLLHDAYKMSHTMPKPKAILPAFKQGLQQPSLKGVDFTTAFSDYFAASIKDYSLAFGHLQSLLALVMTDPHHLDGHLDVASPPVAVEDMPGVYYLLGIFSPQHRFSSLLLPATSVININQPTPSQSKPTCIPATENDGTGRFRPITFQCLYQASLKRLATVQVQTIKHRDYISGEVDNDEEQYQAIATKIPNLLDEAVVGLISAMKMSVRGFIRQMRDAANVNVAPDPTVAAIKIAKATGVLDDLYVDNKPMEEELIPGVTSLFESDTDVSAQTVKKDSIPIFYPHQPQAKGYATLDQNPGISEQPMDSRIKQVLRKSLQGQWFIKFKNKLLLKDSLKSHRQQEVLARISEFLTHSRKAIVTLLAGLAAINLEQATAALWLEHDKSKIRKSAEELGAMVSMLMSVKDVAEIFSSQQRVSALLRQRQWIAAMMDREYQAFGLLTTGLEYSIMFFSVLGIFFSIGDMGKQFYHGENGEGIGSIVGIMGSVNLLASQAGKALRHRINQSLIEETGKGLESFSEEFILSDILVEASFFETILYFAAPLGWVGVVLLIAGSVISALLDDDDLTKWAKHGPFGKRTSWRFIHKYNYWSSPGNEKYAYQALMNLISSPRITYIKRHGSDIIIEVLLQRFFPGQDTLELQAWWEKALMPFGKMIYNNWQYEQVAIPHKIIQINSTEQQPRVSKMHYYFPFDHLDFESLGTAMIFRRMNAKVRLIVEHGRLILPSPVFPKAEDNQLDKADTWNQAPKPRIAS